jgi:hypothetical protein
MGSGGGRAVIGRSLVWVLRVHYEVAGYHPVLVRQVVPAASRRCLDRVRAATVKILNASVQHIQVVRTSAESSPVRSCFSSYSSFQAPLNMGYILTEPSLRT